jgi:hypothetical protein
VVRSRIVALCVLPLVLAACADAPSASTEPATELPAGAALVICERDAISLETPVVRAWEDGVHFRFENPGGAAEFSLRHQTWPYGTAEGGNLPPAVSNGRSSIAPGMVLVSCIPERLGSYSDPDPDAETAVLEVVDPAGLYVSWDLACGEGEQFRMHLQAGGHESVVEAFRRVPGIEPSDRFQRPFIHDLRFIGRRSWSFAMDEPSHASGLPPLGDQWELLVDACPGSGITKRGSGS